VLESTKYKVLYDFNIFIDRLISACHPDLVLVNKEVNHTFLIDVACVMDRNVVMKEREKVEKYMDLPIEFQWIWGTTIKIIPLIFGAFGTISNHLFTHIYNFLVKDLNVHQLQKTVILRAATIIRRHLSLTGSSLPSYPIMYTYVVLNFYIIVIIIFLILGMMLYLYQCKFVFFFLLVQYCHFSKILLEEGLTTLQA